MRLLVLGGTVFLSRAVAADAVRRGHEVVCAARGVSGSVPDGAALVHWDRAEPPPTALTEAHWDAVVDVGRYPAQVRAAVRAFPTAHWVFVSTVNVYAEESPGGTPATLPLLPPRDEDVDRAQDPEAYGPMKVACEEHVLAGAASASVVRPGLIVGPGDPSGRYSYWPARLARGGTVLAPGQPEDPVQVIDVRDLAAWIVTLAEERRTGVFDGVGPVLPLAEVLAETAAGVGAEPAYTWVPDSFLDAHGVQPWMGPEAVPLWLPRPEYDGMMTHDPTPSVAAGLVTRPIADTARDTLAWLRATPSAAVSGIGADREVDLLTAFGAAP